MDDFYKHLGMNDGHLNSCKECRRSYRANRPKERIAAIERKRNKKPKRKLYRKSNLKRWRKQNPETVRAQKKRHPEKMRARYAVANAIRDGRLKKRPCEVCGAKKVEGHHEDYSRPLDVNWLCNVHHRARHSEIDGEQ